MTSDSSGDSRDEYVTVENCFTQKLSEPFLSMPFPVCGQGTFIFNIKSNIPLWISVEDEDKQNSLVLFVDSIGASFLKHKNKDIYDQLKTCCGKLETDKKISYWYSYDRNNLVLKYGKGYRMEETTLMTCNFLEDATDKKDQIRKEMSPFFNAVKEKFVRLYTYNAQSHGQGPGLQITEKMVEFEKHPFICNVPPLVLDSSRINLLDLDKGNFVFSASLPPACKELYRNIRSCTLDEELSDAIRHSLITDGLTLNKKIRDKAPIDTKMSYLRVTFGHSLGKSPGIPYVLEIWPQGHYSPIHNHGNANAVIKVLFGKIHICIYNKDAVDLDAKPIKEFDAIKDDVTWINRNWYQTHKVTNETQDYCATIQCYNYDSGDTAYWPYFDYVKENKVIGEFLPNSDFTYHEMSKQVLEEYQAKTINKS